MDPAKYEVLKKVLPNFAPAMVLLSCHWQDTIDEMPPLYTSPITVKLYLGLLRISEIYKTGSERYCLSSNSCEIESLL
jgi:hypothetical protein